MLRTTMLSSSSSSLSSVVSSLFLLLLALLLSNGRCNVYHDDSCCCYCIVGVDAFHQSMIVSWRGRSSKIVNTVLQQWTTPFHIIATQSSSSSSSLAAMSSSSSASSPTTTSSERTSSTSSITKQATTTATTTRTTTTTTTTTNIPLDDPGQKAFTEQPPHAGCHFRPTHPGTSRYHGGPKKSKRFFEGWYYRVTIPDGGSNNKNKNKIDDGSGGSGSSRSSSGTSSSSGGSGSSSNDDDDDDDDENENSPMSTGGGVSFAFIVSIEDPFENSPLSLACHQIMGPNDEYLVQSDPDHTKFWAWRSQQALGCVFDYTDNNNSNSNDNSNSNSNNNKGVTTTSKDMTMTTIIDPVEWNDTVQSGFQILPNRIQGKLIGHDGSLGGVGPQQGIPGTCSYDISISPLAGWGDDDVGQKSTAGWLASYKVFEPHWQVTMADGRASGSVTWRGTNYTFVDAPFYAEKNWGGAFPIRWYWCQCNSFDGYCGSTKDNHLSVTAGGGTRKIPLGQRESLGMVSVHHNGVMYEATPWLGDMAWSVSPWGSWIMTGRCTGGGRPFEVELEAKCDAPGVVLRAPTERDGMEYFCRDSFLADVTLSLWELEYDVGTKTFHRGRVIVDNARSSQGAVEIGGGPWWYNWTAKSNMKQPMKGMVRLPYRLQNLRKRIVGRRRQ